MRRPLPSLALVALALVPTACGGDKEEARCIAVSAETAELLGIPATFAAKAPEEANWTANGRTVARYYYASPDGGLWIVLAELLLSVEADSPLARQLASALGDGPVGIVPVNEQARTESDLNTAVRPDSPVLPGADSPVLEGTDPASDEAEMALACAEQDTSTPDI